MNTEIQKPPPVIHSARTLFYAVNDESVEFTDRINLFVGDPKNSKKLGEMPLLAICENYYKPHDILLFFCDENWEPQGTIALATVEDAKEKAEKGYKGITEKWKFLDISQEELNQFLREEYGVDPSTEWWKVECSFCGKDETEANRLFGGNNAYICDECICNLYEIITEEKNA